MITPFKFLNSSSDLFDGYIRRVSDHREAMRLREFVRRFAAELARVVSAYELSYLSGIHIYIYIYRNYMWDLKYP